MNTIGYYLRPNPTDTAAQAPVPSEARRQEVGRGARDGRGDDGLEGPAGDLQVQPGGGRNRRGLVLARGHDLRPHRRVDAALPFREPAYVDIYGTLRFENDSIRGEVPVVPKE